MSDEIKHVISQNNAECQHLCNSQNLLKYDLKRSNRFEIYILPLNELTRIFNMFCAL